jgi:glycosyltransferase involved in cell wall biosynthesis
MSADPAPAIAWKPYFNDAKIASTRLRALLPCRYLKEAGWQCEMFDPKNADSYELVIFQKAYEEESITLAETLGGRGVKTVFDMCDNHFYNPSDLQPLRERAERMRRMISVVDGVTVSTPELAKLIEGGCRAVIDDVIEVPRTNPLRAAIARARDRLTNILSRRRLRLVWYGGYGSEHPPAGMIDLPRVFPYLEALNAQIPLELTVISNSLKFFHAYVGKPSFPVRYHEWGLETFAQVFQRHDVCIIPMALNPFTACKTNNRLVLSLLMGVPVIADPIPSYEEFRDFVLFSDWTESLRTYAADRALRRQHVRAGQSYIRSKYNRERVVSQWSALFEQMLGSGRGRA